MIDYTLKNYYYFENLKSATVVDMNAYIDEHWREFGAQVKPATDVYIQELLYLPFSVIAAKVPLEKFFLP
ncbi:hypothetical protein QE152_g39804 [Popillia japonica]|uniref:Uncharacterized protein n=1 Tax=Popillia japonica TaxID=7064 RepID=A0AAW1HST4_POPJA